MFSLLLAVSRVQLLVILNFHVVILVWLLDVSARSWNLSVPVMTTGKSIWWGEEDLAKDKEYKQSKGFPSLV